MSITRDQMSLQIDRLLDCFGDRAFSDQRQHMIWEAVEGLEYPQVIAIVDTFLRSSKHAPLPVDFSTASEGLNRSGKFYLGEVAPKEIASCHDCGDSGFVRVVRLAQFEKWATNGTALAACHCSRGREVLLKLNSGKHPVDLRSTWSAAWEASYRKLPAYAPQWDGPFPLGEERLNLRAEGEA